MEISFLTLSPIKTSVEAIKIVSGNHTVTKPAPLIIMSLRAIMNHFVGMMCEINCITTGIFSIGKIKPDRSKAGKNNPNIHNIIATCCVLVNTDINTPIAQAVNINKIQTKVNKAILPSMGILNINMPKRITIIVQIKEIII